MACRCRKWITRSCGPACWQTSKYWSCRRRSDAMRIQAHLSTMILLASTATAVATDGELPQQAQAILKKCCDRCHGVGSTNEGGINFILDVPTLLAKKTIAAREPGQSLLLKKILLGEMPPEGEEPRLTKAEVAVLERWIAEGAKPFVSADAARRKFLSARDVQRALRDHLAALPTRERPHRRYFTLTHVHNHPGATDAQMRLYRAALAKRSEERRVGKECRSRWSPV